jgi:hypothetical protein
MEERNIIVDFDIEKAKSIFQKHKHNWHDRESYFEAVRMFGDQIDSRFRVLTNGEYVWTFWTDEEGHTDEYFGKLKQDKQLLLILKNANEKFVEEIKNRGEDPNGW